MKKKTLRTLIVILLMIIAILLTFLVPEKKKDTGVKWNTEKREVGYIKIPSFSEIYFTANTDVQGFNFYNPPTNKCAMIVTLVHDGTVYYQSDKITPGYGLHEITLSKALNSGDYQFSFIVECCGLDDTNNERFNGAKFNVLVHAR